MRQGIDIFYACITQISYHSLVPNSLTISSHRNCSYFLLDKKKPLW